MYTSESKGFTVITNFGCKYNCPYCVTKHHPVLAGQVTNEDNVDWEYLTQCIKESPAPTVCISGGGDPFYNYQEHMDFYRRLHSIVTSCGKGLDVHTRIIPDSAILLSIFRKIALTVEYFDKDAINNLRENINTIHRWTTLRVIQVVDDKMSKDDVLSYVKTLQDIGVKQITFRQMFGNEKAYQHFYELRDALPQMVGVMWLEDGEYHNYYFTTNNTLYPYFFGQSIDDRNYWKSQYELYN